MGEIFLVDIPEMTTLLEEEVMVLFRSKLELQGRHGRHHHKYTLARTWR